MSNPPGIKSPNSLRPWNFRVTLEEQELPGTLNNHLKNGWLSIGWWTKSLRRKLVVSQNIHFLKLVVWGFDVSVCFVTNFHTMKTPQRFQRLPTLLLEPKSITSCESLQATTKHLFHQGQAVSQDTSHEKIVSPISVKGQRQQSWLVNLPPPNVPPPEIRPY